MERSEIHNYYEQLVFNFIDQQLLPELDNPTEDYILDLACIALNKLPCRYIRHDVDTAFFLTSDERLQMDTGVKKAVTEARDYLDSQPDSRK